MATARAVESMYMEWRRQHRAGMRRAQEDVLARNAAARACRAYVSNVIPGFFQTADYAEALMRSITDFQGTPDDIPEAVAARLARSRFLYEGDHRFVVLIEEWVLRTRIGTPATMAGQLQHLLTVMPLPSVSLASSRSVSRARCGRWRRSTSTTTGTPWWKPSPPASTSASPANSLTTPKPSRGWRRWPSMATPPARSSGPPPTPWSESAQLSATFLRPGPRRP